MIRINRFWRLLFTVLLLGRSCLVSHATTMTKIAPLQTRIALSSQSSENRRLIPIRSNTGKTVYALSLEPYLEIKRHIAGLNLVLRNWDEKTDAPNLLEPTGNWHGLQAYDFVGRDFAQGVQESAFGEKRTVTLKKLGLIVRITVTKATVSQISANDYQFDALELQIDVDNLNP